MLRTYSYGLSSSRRSPSGDTFDSIYDIIRGVRANSTPDQYGLTSWGLNTKALRRVYTGNWHSVSMPVWTLEGPFSGVHGACNSACVGINSRSLTLSFLISVLLPTIPRHSRCHNTSQPPRRG